MEPAGTQVFSLEKNNDLEERETRRRDQSKVLFDLEISAYIAGKTHIMI